MPSRKGRKGRRFILNEENKGEVLDAIAAIGHQNEHEDFTSKSTKKIESEVKHNKEVQLVKEDGDFKHDAELDEFIRSLEDDHEAESDDFPDDFVNLAGGAHPETQVSQQVSAKVNRYLNSMLPTIEEEAGNGEVGEIDELRKLNCQFEKLLHEYCTEDPDNSPFKCDSIDYSELFADFIPAKQEVTEDRNAEVVYVDQKFTMLEPEKSVRSRLINNGFRLSTLKNAGCPRRIELLSNAYSSQEKIQLTQVEDHAVSKRKSNHSIERMKQRNRNETLEERRLRKKAWKEIRAENRRIKKETKLAFKMSSLS
ncbi:hypothetical protein ACOME3_007098 [Neoechinorhynchus agilis]